MTTQTNYQPSNHASFLNGISNNQESPVSSSQTFSFRYGPENPGTTRPSLPPDGRPYKLLTDEAATEMVRGGIPNLEQVCRDLYQTFHRQSAPYSALQFIPILKELVSVDQAEIERFLQNPRTHHVLVQNTLLKVVLIHWEPGKLSSIHGHPKGGCIFKVLQGSLEEKRYSPEESPRLMAISTFLEGSMAYIDDNMAYHAVGNPFDEAAVSLHVYTPGK